MTSSSLSVDRIEWIDSNDALKDFVSFAATQQAYYLDTEFHRERTYFPRLALVQIAVLDRLAVVDPLAVDVSLLSPLLISDALGVLHAAQQDLDVLSHACGSIPAKLFDTQLAAGFLGYSTPSLVSLLSTFMKKNLPKGDRLTDWLRRPLTEAQVTYAANDVVYLPDLEERISTELQQLGRMQWAMEACEELRQRPTGTTDPMNAWLRVKDVRGLRGQSRWVAQSLAKWREERAMALDIPVRHVLSDLVIVSVASRMPKTANELSHIRGLDDKMARGSLGGAILEAVTDGLNRADGELHLPTPEGDDLDRSLRPAVTLISAWVNELARNEQVDPTLLATRADIVDLLREAPNARLRQGWRSDIVGRDIEDLLNGRRALSFGSLDNGSRGLRLVDTPAIETRPVDTSAVDTSASTTRPE
jgi:ribonuclease D